MERTDYKSLYELTDDIKDLNTMLVPLKDLKELEKKNDKVD